jgi:DNA-binding PucR family transcriptional regulator
VEAVESPVEALKMRRLQRELDVSSVLLNAVSTDEPIAALASQLSSLCRGTAVVYDADGAIVASAGEAPTQLIWNEISQTNVPNLQFTIGRWSAQTRTVGLQDGVHVLAIASKNEALLDQDGEILLDTAERMLGAVNGIQHGASMRNRRDNEHLLALLQDGVLPSREHRFWARMAQFNFVGYIPVRAIDASAPLGQGVSESMVDSLVASARKAGVPLLITIRKLDQDEPPTMNAIVPATKPADRWLSRVSKEFIVGASSPFSSLAETPSAFREAETALGIAQSRARFVEHGTSGTARLMVKLDEVDVTTWALAHVDGRQLEQRVLSVLEQFDDAEVLKNTLVTYLALDQNIGAAAEAMFVHANTVRYRLARIEEIYGEPVSSAAFVANLYLCLQDEILGRKHALHAGTQLSS